jgi:hypothetical protein
LRIAGFSSFRNMPCLTLVTVGPLSSCPRIDRTLGVPEHCEHNLFGWRLCSEFLRRMICWVLPLYTLVLLFWVIILDPGLVFSADVIQNIFTCIMVQLLKARDDVWTLVLFCQNFGAHLAQTLWYPRMSRTIVWAGPWLIFNHVVIPLIVFVLSSTVMAVACSCLSLVVGTDGRPEHSSSVTLSRSLLNISIHSHASRWDSTLSPHWEHADELQDSSQSPPIENKPQPFVLA